ncbi:SCO family protein [Lewinella sp. LCG006]|uniref:SCO family protein n=1 Tax=Lewinella sp. LCG006 TaxID=3231911 RepID=UPI00346072A4
MKYAFYIFLLLGLFNSSCQSKEALPVLGPYEKTNGEKVFHPVRDFRLFNQDSIVVTNTTFQEKIRVVDFFFISCPSICPKVQAQMLKIQEIFQEEKEVVLVSHTIDPKRDNVAAMARYATNIGVERADRWQFLTGDRALLYQLADDHFNIVVEDDSAPGGFDHTGRIVLIDKKGYIRSYANGTNPASVDTLIQDIQQLLLQE